MNKQRGKFEKFMSRISQNYCKSRHVYTFSTTGSSKCRAPTHWTEHRSIDCAYVVATISSRQNDLVRFVGFGTSYSTDLFRFGSSDGVLDYYFVHTTKCFLQLGALILLCSTTPMTGQLKKRNQKINYNIHHKTPNGEESPNSRPKYK